VNPSRRLNPKARNHLIYSILVQSDTGRQDKVLHGHAGRGREAVQGRQFVQGVVRGQRVHGAVRRAALHGESPPAVAAVPTNSSLSPEKSAAAADRPVHPLAADYALYKLAALHRLAATTGMPVQDFILTARIALDQNRVD
jgi:hypothetical protein